MSMTAGNIYSPPAAVDEGPLLPVPVRIIRAPWVGRYVIPVIRYWPLAGVPAWALLIGISFLRRHYAGGTDSSLQGCTTLVFLLNLFALFQLADDRNLIQQAEDILPAAAIAVGWVKRTGHGQMKGALCLSAEEIRFRPTGRKAEILLLPLKEIAGVIPDANRDRLIIRRKDGRSEAFDTIYAVLWAEELEKTMSSLSGHEPPNGS